jgi:signal transduction histidine kinase
VRTAATLIQRADAAMYRAKGRGAGGYEFFAESRGAENLLSAEVDAAANLPKRAASLLARHEARLRELSDANRELLHTAQIAQKLQAHAEEAHRKQINFVAMAAHAMRTPLSGAPHDRGDAAAPGRRLGFIAEVTTC